MALTIWQRMDLWRRPFKCGEATNTMPTTSCLTARRNRFDCYRELSDFLTQDTDFQVTSRYGHNQTYLVAAIHGGIIEPGTSDIARLIAEDNLGLYLFEGLNSSVDYDSYHITSTCFDEPKLEDLLQKHQTVISIHGCRDSWGPSILLGGLDRALKQRIYQRLVEHDLPVQSDDHPFLGQEEQNICNRGLGRAGLQIEIPRKIRNQSDLYPKIAGAIRSALNT